MPILILLDIMEVDTLSRIQFALTAGFHFLFPPITIGLSLFIVLIEAMFLRSGREIYKIAAKFFLKLFAVIFAIGVVTGIVLEFEFGTNWPVYSRFVGDVFGSPLAIEAVFAFFMESIFLGIAIWGWNRLGKKSHFVSTLLMCIGTHLSAVWIIAANSFMQTPAGFELQYETPVGIVEVLPDSAVPDKFQIPSTRAVITDFWDMAFSASMMDRFLHTISASWLCGAFFALGVCGYMLLRKPDARFGSPCARVALVYAAVAAVFMMFTGHGSARLLAQTQPEKLSAFEGHYKTSKNAPLYIFGWVDEDSRHVSGLKAKGLFSLLAYGSFDKEVKGLEDLPSDEFLAKIHPGASKPALADIRPDYWPPVNFCFQTFRAMVYLGGLIGAFIVWGFGLWIMNELFDMKKRRARIFWKAAMFSTLLPVAASQFGWAAAEVGRQPWIVWHVLKTSDAVTTAAAPEEILFSIILFSLIFTAIAVLGCWVLYKKIVDFNGGEA